MKWTLMKPHQYKQGCLRMFLIYFIFTWLTWKHDNSNFWWIHYHFLLTRKKWVCAINLKRKKKRHVLLEHSIKPLLVLQFHLLCLCPPQHIMMQFPLSAYFSFLSLLFFFKAIIERSSKCPDALFFLLPFSWWNYIGKTWKEEDNVRKPF